MNYRSHLIGGAVVYTILLYLLNLFNVTLTLEQKCIALIICLFGALFPDFDTKSKIQIWLYRVAFISLLILAILFPYNPYIWVGALILLTPLIVNHRGIFHNIWFLTLLPIGVALVLSNFYPQNQLFFFIMTSFFIGGTLSHLILDRWK